MITFQLYKSSFIQEIEMEIKELSKRHIQCETNFPLKDTGALGKLKKVYVYNKEKPGCFLKKKIRCSKLLYYIMRSFT